MKQLAKKALKHPMIYGSTIVVTGGIFANFFNFLFNLYMSRNLSVADYGVLASIVSFITFPSLFAAAINPVVIRFAGDYFAKGELAYVRGLYNKFMKVFIIIGLLLFLIFLLFISQLGEFLKVTNHTVLVIADLAMFVMFISIINIAFLQAKLAFLFQVIVSLVGALLKLSLGLLFVLLGYSVSGAFGGMLLSGIGALIVSFIPLKELFSKNIQTPNIDTKEIFFYGIPAALTMFGLISFISVDIILVKHFFDPFHAGQYAGLSLIGRIIFFISVPIGGVMFPVLVRKHTKGDNLSNTFKLAIFMILIPSFLLTLLYFLFPNFAILFFLKRTEYLSIGPLLGLFGLYISFYSMLYIFANFYLSIKKTKIYIPILTGAICQIVLLALFHQTFMQIIMISFVIVLLLLISFLLYYPYAIKK